jgi:predicted exporter
MPYFIYEIFPPGRLVLVDNFAVYREARARARTLRAALGANAAQTIRVIYAQSTEQATRRLTEVREPRPLGEE